MEIQKFLLLVSAFAHRVTLDLVDATGDRLLSLGLLDAARRKLLLSVTVRRRRASVVAGGAVLLLARSALHLFE